MHSLRDRLFGEILRRNGIASEAAIEGAFAHIEEEAAAGRSWPLGQVLIKQRVIEPEIYLKASRVLERRIFRCEGCGESFAAADLDVPDPPVACPRCGADVHPPADLASVPSSDLAIEDLPGRASSSGRTFGRYELKEVLGEGSMGVVYKAWDPDLKRTVALKVLRPLVEPESSDHVKRFLREAQACARLHHPNIVAVHEVGLAEGSHFLTMEHCEGPTLYQRIIQGHRFTVEESLELVGTLARAVHYAHEKGIVHRDLKPGNIILSPEGPKIADFGLAKPIAESGGFITKTGVAIGTPLYMSPEQARGDMQNIGPRSDVFALGILLYQLSTGTLPFVAENHIEIYNKIIEDRPEPPRRLNPDMARPVEAIIGTALRKDRDARYPTAGALAEDIERHLGGEEVEARSPGVSARLAAGIDRHRAALALGVAVFVVLLGTGAIGWALLARSDRAERDAAREGRRLARTELEAARTARSEDRTPDAREHAMAAAVRAPGAPEAIRARILLGDLALDEGRTEEAFPAYGRAYRRAERPTDRARALVALARGLIRTGRPDRARSLAERTLQRWPETEAGLEARLLVGRLRVRGLDAGGLPLLEEVAGGEAGPAAAAREELRWARPLLGDGPPVVRPGPVRVLVAGESTGEEAAHLLGLGPGGVSVLAGGDGGPPAVTRTIDTPLPRGEAVSLLLEDWDADGTADLLVAGGRRLAVRPGGEADPSWRVVDLPGRVAPGALAVADLDDDAWPEAWVGLALPGGGVARVEAVPSGGPPTVRRVGPDGQGPAGEVLALEAGHLAGGPMLAIGRGGPAGYDVVLRRPDEEEAARHRRIGRTTALLAGDHLGDGRVLLACGRSPAPELPPAVEDAFPASDGLWLLAPEGSDGPEVVREPAATEGPVRTGVRALARGDLLGDGSAETVLAAVRWTADGPRGSVAVHEAIPGAGAAFELDLGRVLPRTLTAADLDGDGRDELALSDGSGRVHVLGWTGGTE